MRFTLLAFIVSVFAFSAPAHAALKVDITRGNVAPLPLAMTDFEAGGAAADIGAQMSAVIQNDLERSGLFQLIDKRAFIQDIKGVEAMPRFIDWRQINAQALVVGTITEQGGGRLSVQFRLWDVLSEKQFAGKSYQATTTSWRRIAHLIADEIYSRLTGESGYFDTRIVFVDESGDRRKKTKRLAIMDQDGYGVKYLTSGRDLVMTPRFDPSSQKIVYLAYYGGKPRVYLYDISSGSQRVLGSFKGMTFAPRFSPDGNKVIMSASLDGNSEIFTMDLRGGSIKRLTDDAAIDTSPSFSPDSSQVVFNSDRGGSQQLYVMNADGSDVKRISFGSGNYGTPVWSPRGDLIAFTKMRGNTFHIGVMRPDGSGERLLTESFMDEGPTWAPNGRVIIFARQTEGGEYGIYSIDLTGYNERRIDTPSEASDPAWSPLLSKQ